MRAADKFSLKKLCAIDTTSIVVHRHKVSRDIDFHSTRNKNCQSEFNSALLLRLVLKIDNRGRLPLWDLALYIHDQVHEHNFLLTPKSFFVQKKTRMTKLPFWLSALSFNFRRFSWFIVNTLTLTYYHIKVSLKASCILKVYKTKTCVYFSSLLSNYNAYRNGNCNMMTHVLVESRLKLKILIVDGIERHLVNEF